MATIMPQIELELLSFQDQASAHQEAWKKPHDDAMLCRDVEDLISKGMHARERVLLRFGQWRDEVASGKMGYDPDGDRFFQNLFSIWDDVSKAVLEDALKIESQTGLKVDGLSAFADAIGKSPYAIGMTRERFAKIAVEHPPTPERCEQEEKSLSQYN